jgi:predicted ATP-dependent endonuclease of OLD family
VKLARIRIENLFGQFDYDITLNQKDGITILTGPNGCGKTTLLDTIWRLFSGKPLSVPCSTIICFFFDASKQEWLGDRDTLRDLIQVYGVKITYGAAARYEGEAPLNRVIEVCSKNLVKRIARIKAEEDRLAIELSNTLPERLLTYARPLHPGIFEERFEKLSLRRLPLERYGIRPGVFTKPEYAEENQRVLSLSLEDYERKASLYDDLFVQIELFVSVIEDKYLTNKTFTVNGRRGFCFTRADGSRCKCPNFHRVNSTRSYCFTNRCLTRLLFRLSDR